jgi:hypothetical protein
MKKNTEKETSSISVDAVTGEYTMQIPEWILNEFGWYEDTVLNLKVEGNEIVVSEYKGD